MPTSTLMSNTMADALTSAQDTATDLVVLNATASYPLDNGTSHQEDSEFQWRLLVARNVILPLFVAVGLVGNTLSLLVFTRGRFKQMSTSKYLAALAVTDNVFLSTLFLIWLNDFLPVLTSAGACKVVVFLSYLGSFLSVYFVVCFTSERYVAICHPLQAPYILAKMPARAVVAVLVVSSVVLYSCSLWSTTITRYPTKNACSSDPNYLRMLNVLTWTDTALTMFIPFVLLVVMNSFIAVAVCQSYTWRNRSLNPLLNAEKHHSTQNSSVHRHSVLSSQRSRLSGRSQSYAFAQPPGANSNNNNSNANASFSSAPRSGSGGRDSRRLVQQPPRRAAFLSHFQLRTTRTLLFVSVTFLVLNLPSHVLRLLQLLSVSDGNSLTLQGLLVQEVTQLTYYSTFALNFFLYTLYGRHFQQALRDLATKTRHGLKTCCRGNSTRSRTDSGSRVRAAYVYSTVSTTCATSGVTRSPPSESQEQPDSQGETVMTQV